MRKTISLILAMVMVLSLSVCVFAANETSGSTDINYIGTRETDGDVSASEGEYYTIEIPATMTPGETATVSVEGYWALNRTLKIVADDSKVTMTNSEDGSTKDLAVTFAGISKVGSNTESVSASTSVSIADMSEILFGNWNGTLNFTISVE